MKQPLPGDIVVTPLNRRLRLLHVEPNGERAWAIDIDEELAVPISQSYQWLCCDCKPLKSSTPSGSSKSDIASDAMKRLRDRAWGLIEPLVEDSGIYEASYRAERIRNRAKEAKTSATTLRLHLRRYWQGGMTTDALLGNYDNSGKGKNPPTAPPGRRTKGGQAPYLLGDADFKAFRKAVDGFYLKEGYHTITGTHQWMLERHYTYTDGNGVKFIKPEGEYPSVRQLTTWLQKNYSMEYQLRKRLGDKRFEQNHRHKLGSIELDCQGAGHMYEIDATIADIFLVSSKDPKAIVGKPTMYLIIDRATRLIVGWYVGFENASYMAAVQAILSIAEDKVEVCRRYGLEHDAADWPADGILPEQFIADQGELSKLNARRRVSAGIRSFIANVPGLRPDWKPLVESGFKMTHQIIAAGLPAYDPPGAQGHRRVKAYYRDATLNLEQFTSLIVKAIITHNRTLQKNFPLTVHQVASQVRPIPRDLWDYEVRSRVGALARFNADSVRLELLPRETAVATEHGLHLRDTFYTFSQAEKDGWFVKARKKRFKVEVALDYRLCDTIVAYDPFVPGKRYEAKLTMPYEKFKGMSFADVRRHFTAVESLTTGSTHQRRQNLHGYHQHANPIIDDSKKALIEAAGGKKLSRKGRRADTVKARSVDLHGERQEKAAIPSLATPVAMPSGTPLPPGPLAPVVTLLDAQRTAPAPEVIDPNRPLTLKERLAAERKKQANG